MGKHSSRRSGWSQAIRVARIVWLASLVISSAGVVIGKVGRTNKIGTLPQAEAATPAPTPTPTASTEPALPPTPSPEPFSPPAGPLAPVYGSKIKNAHGVVFITMDDGYLADERVANLIIANHLPVTLFLMDSAARSHEEYFKRLVAAGATVEDHTMTHPQMPKLSYEAQRKQICDAADDYKRMFGYRPLLFRPPFGAYTATTQRAAHACGMKAMFLWTASMNFGYIAVQDKNLSSGEIILMHFRPDTFDNLTNLLKELKKRNLTVGRLEDYVGNPT